MTLPKPVWFALLVFAQSIVAGLWLALLLFVQSMSADAEPTPKPLGESSLGSVAMEIPAAQHQHLQIYSSPGLLPYNIAVGKSCGETYTMCYPGNLSQWSRGNYYGARQ